MFPVGSVVPVCPKRLLKFLIENDIPNASELEPDHDLVEDNGRSQACGLIGVIAEIGRLA